MTLWRPGIADQPLAAVCGVLEMSKTPRGPRVFLSTKTNREPHQEVQAKLSHAREFGLDAELEALEQFVREANIWLDGSPMPEISAKRVRARLLHPEEGIGDWERRQPGAQIPEGERRWLIPDLWPWGTTPLLTGQPKAGKSTLVAELVASLAIPGRKFLDHFESASLSEDEKFSGGITVISAEGAPEDYERELVRLGVDSDSGADQSLVTMHHLEADQLSFDLADPEIFDEWLIKLAVCDECDGTDDMVPTVIVVDGITAVLQNAGKGVEYYAAWIAAFRRLQRALGTPNGLVVGHSTFSGGHSLGNTEGSAQSDGLWGYISSDVDNPTATRKFKVTPRLGGIAISPTPVKLVDGRLVLVSRHGKTEEEESFTEDVQGPEKPDMATRVLEFVADHHQRTGSWPSAGDLKRVSGSKPAVRAARDELVEAGELEKLPRPGRGGGDLYAIADTAD